MKKLLLALAISLGFASSMQPISNQVVYASSLGTALGTGLFINYLTESNIAGLIVGLGSGLLTYGILYQYTPEGRFSRAKTAYDQISKNYFATNEFESEEAFFAALDDLYVLHDLPLVAAYNTLTGLIEQGFDALNLLEAAKSEGNSAMVQECELLYPRIRCAIELMTQSAKRIRSNTEFIKQVKIQKEVEAAKASLAVQKQIANAQMYRAYSR